MDNLFSDLRHELKDLANEQDRISAKRFFKEEVKFYGMKSSELGKVSLEFFKKVKDLGKQKVFEICEDLFKSQMYEETIIAASWSEKFSKEFEEEDFSIFEKWVNLYVNNWATCDTFCNHTVGNFLQKFPEFVPKLFEWTRSENRWVRRASAVSLIVPARKGMFLNEVFKIADLLLVDSDDLVQKGYGWLLKVAAEKHEREVFEFVIERKAVMPRTALRYAIEKMPKELKAKAMSK